MLNIGSDKKNPFVESDYIKIYLTANKTRPTRFSPGMTKCCHIRKIH